MAKIIISRSVIQPHNFNDIRIMAVASDTGNWKKYNVSDMKFLIVINGKIER